MADEQPELEYTVPLQLPPLFFGQLMHLIIEKNICTELREALVRQAPALIMAMVIHGEDEVSYIIRITEDEYATLLENVPAESRLGQIARQALDTLHAYKAVEEVSDGMQDGG